MNYSSYYINDLDALLKEFSVIFRRVSIILILILFIVLPFRGLITITEGVSIAVPLGALVGGTWISSVVLNPTIRRPDTLHLIFALLILWMGITTLWAIQPGSSFIDTIRFALYLVIALAIWDLFRTRRVIDLALMAYIIGAFFVMTVEMYYYFTLSVQNLSTLSNPNYLSGRLLFALPFAWYFVFRDTDRIFNSFRIISILFIGLLIPTIVWTGSRQGLIAMIMGLGVLLLITGRIRRNLTYLAIIIIGVLVYAHRYLGERFQEIPIILNEIFNTLQGETVAEPTTRRVTVYEGAVDLIKAQPITGHGLGNFDAAFSAMHPDLFYSDAGWSSHNSYLGMAAETGIIGLILFLTIFALLLYRIGSHPNKQLIIGFLTIWATLSLTNDWHTGFAVWGNLFLLLCITRIPPEK